MSFLHFDSAYERLTKSTLNHYEISPPLVFGFQVTSERTRIKHSEFFLPAALSAGLFSAW